MNIIECEEMKRIKKHDLIPTVIDHIFTICKEDKQFKTNSKLKVIDEKLIILDKKIFKQKSLIEKSEILKTDILSKMKKLDDESFSLKYKILENLGSEI